MVTLATVLLAGLLVPLGPFQAPVPPFAGDAILLAYLFGLGRFFTTAAALDTGSSFEGMGAAREVTFACFSEPALFFALLVLARLSDSTELTLSKMLHLQAQWKFSAPLVLVAVGLFVVLLAETCRIPVDDPNTHLELTMIHEVMVLDHSGPLLGTILYGAAVKLFVLGAFLLHVIVPWHPATPSPASWVLFVAGMLGLSVAIGVVESTMARVQIRHVPTLLIGAMLFCGFAFFLAART